MQNWPYFRGFQGSATAASPHPPQHWDGPAGHNILWKVPVPLAGASSPIVWDDRVFLTGGTATKQEVYCFNAATGALLWQRPVTGPVATDSLSLGEDTGFAPNTMATDGQRVYAIFPTGDLAAFDFAGRQLWAKNLGKPENTYGHASSLVTYRDRVIIQFDQGDDAAQHRAALLALDGPTGKPVWKTPRAVVNSWASPIVIYPASGPQIITAAKPLVAAYDPADGHELWSANLLDGDVAPSPVYVAGMVFAVSDQAALNAIRINGHGDVTKSALAWSATEGLPDIVSPLATPEVVLLANSTGLVTCYDAHNGKQLWQHDFELKIHASPVVAGKTIYLIDRNGATHLLDAGPTFKEIATLPLGESVSASPALVRDRLYIRGKSNLYCIGGP